MVRLLAAQYDLETVIGQSAPGSVPAEAEAQRDRLAAMQRSLAHAGPAALSALRAEIAAVATNVTGLALQARAGANAAAAAELAEASATTGAQIRDQLREIRRLDPYLQFPSVEEEAEYRRREADRRAYIDAQLATGTPEGSLNA